LDRLTAFVAINHLRLRLHYLERHPELLGNEMTPKLQGVAAAMSKLRHGLEDRSGKLLDRIGAADKRGASAFDKANSSLDDTERSMAEVEEFIASIEGANGGPTLGDSSASPEEPDPINRRGQPV
jgi:hypothetical protein